MKQSGAARNGLPFSCRGYKNPGIDGTDHDCDYKYAGEVDCDMCVVCGGDYDPRTGKRYVERRKGKK